MMAMNNTELVEQVENALQEDKRTADAVIEVIDENGLVTLKGTVSSAKIREAAEAIAKAQEGVLDVTNALEVGSDADDTIVIAAPPGITTAKSAAKPPYGQ